MLDIAIPFACTEEQTSMAAEHAVLVASLLGALGTSFHSTSFGMYYIASHESHRIQVDEKLTTPSIYSSPKSPDTIKGSDDMTGNCVHFNNFHSSP